MHIRQNGANLLRIVFAFFLLVGTSHAVELGSTVHLVPPIINGESAAGWSPDGLNVLLAELHRDKRAHLCVYDVKAKRKERCIFSLSLAPNTGVHAIDWTSEYIHVAAGYEDGSVIYRVRVPDWRSPHFKELDLAKGILPDTYSDPAWDRWEPGLFFSGKDERYGIQFLDSKGKAKKYASGLYPAVTAKYLWYTALTNDGDLQMDGLARLEKRSGKLQKLTTKNVDVSVSPRQDERSALFIRRIPDGNKAAIYAWVEGQGIIGPLLVSASGEDLMHVQLSPDGKQALITATLPDKKNPLDAVVTLRLVEVRW